MKRILAVVGSPRRNGNTHILVSKIAEGARTKGAVVDELFLGELTIKECDGCHVCWEGKECSKDDDMQAVYPRIIQSDVIIFGTPVYWYGPTAIRGKSAVIAVPFEEESAEMAKPVVEFFKKCLSYLQVKLVGKIIVPGVSRKGEIRQKPERLEEAYELGRRMA